MHRNWRDEALKIIDERYRAAKSTFPDLEPKMLFRHIDTRYPFETYETKAHSIWLVAVEDYRIAVTRPDLVTRFELNTPLFGGER